MSTVLLASGGAIAADESLESARRCAQLQDSLQRLVCYDRVFPPGQVAPAPATAPAIVAAAPPVAIPAPVVIAPPVVSSAPVAAPAPVVTPTPVAPPVPAAAAETGKFGAETLRRTDEDRKAEEPPRSITAQVTSVRETRPEVYRMTLENGQVWDQMDMDVTFSVKDGDTVQIERGRMGGYRLSRTSRGGSGWVRVTRLR
jgi:hypothetical protein